jgi:hypothetical protein
VEGRRPLEKAELISRARAGDSAAFTQLVQHYQELAFRTAFLIVGDAADAEDALVKAASLIGDHACPENAFAARPSRSRPHACR